MRIAPFRLLQLVVAGGTMALLALLLLPESSGSVQPAASSVPASGPQTDRDAKLGRGALRRAGETTLSAEPIPYGRAALGDAGADTPGQLPVSTRSGAGFVSQLSRGASLFFENVSRHLFRVSTVEVQGLHRLRRDEVLRVVGLDEVPYVWRRGAAEMERQLNALAWVEHSTVRLTPFPARAFITIQEAEPWLIAEYERHSWIISKHGKLLQPLDSVRDAQLILDTAELSRLDGLDEDAGNMTALSSANARFRLAIRSIDWLETAGELPFPIGRYHLLSNGALVLQQRARTHLPAARLSDSADDPQIIVRLESLVDARNAVARLNSVLRDAKLRGEHIRRIDLRFRGQAIVE